MGMYNIFQTLLTNLQTIRTDTGLLTDLVSLRMNSQSKSNKEIKMDIKYEHQDQTLKISDKMSKTPKNMVEEFFSTHSGKISQFHSFKYVDSDISFEKSEGISHSKNS